MVYCNLKGGLGNIMFQIAATKSISINKNTDCAFPNLNSYLTFLNNERLHNPSLQHAHEYLNVFKNINYSKPNRAIPTINFPFHYVNLDLPDHDFYIDGFFQSEKYFSNHRKEILELFRPLPQIEELISTKYSEYLKHKITSVHVRRGDYLRFPNHHPAQTIEYYKNSINFLKSKTDIFLIFSDSIDWCEENFKDDNVFFIKNEKDYIELYLMSMCNNNIICNSSFSWWGAWLNNNNDKIVIGPQKWFGSAIHHDESDIIPETWIKF